MRIFKLESGERVAAETDYHFHKETDMYHLSIKFHMEVTKDEFENKIINKHKDLDKNILVEMFMASVCEVFAPTLQERIRREFIKDYMRIKLEENLGGLNEDKI